MDNKEWQVFVVYCFCLLFRDLDVCPNVAVSEAVQVSIPSVRTRHWPALQSTRAGKLQQSYFKIAVRKKISQLS